MFCFVKHKTAYEMRISDWSSDVCSSDLVGNRGYRRRRMRTNQLIIALFQRFCWLDEGLQARLHDRGWPDISRPQSMVMTNIVSGIVRPSDIARNLGVSRQAIHNTINQMVKLGLVEIGSASVRERVCKYGPVWVVAEYLKK